MQFEASQSIWSAPNCPERLFAIGGIFVQLGKLAPSAVFNSLAHGYTTPEKALLASVSSNTFPVSAGTVGGDDPLFFLKSGIAQHASKPSISQSGGSTTQLGYSLIDSFLNSRVVKNVFTSA
jgi:hypothetical protein